MKLSFLRLVFASSLFVSCSTGTVREVAAGTAAVTVVSPTATGTITLSPLPNSTATRASITSHTSSEAFSYLTSALDIMQANSVNRKQIDWGALRATVYSRAQGAQQPWETYDAIRFALLQLGDRHSFFMTRPEAAQRHYIRVDDNPPQGKLLEGKLGYIAISGFGGSDLEQVTRYATEVQQITREVDAHNPCGWIVDLRQNDGGNMWPMLAGIGPILGEGYVGAFINPDGQKTMWSYFNGQARLQDEVSAQANDPAYQLQRWMPPVAVLTSKSTASSGEAMAVAFHGRPNTRSFGEGTAGLSTANEGYDLSDGAMIILTVATFADRTDQMYGGVIEPDEFVDQRSSGSDPVQQAAINWLIRQPSCTNGIK